MRWLLVILLILLAGVFVYWQIVITEGVYLGQRVVTLLYDRVAHKYNKIKDYNEADEYQFLGVPLTIALGHNFRGNILDVATGTGRVPVVMHKLSMFRGQVFGLDHSAKMVAVAHQQAPDIPFVVGDALRLPFAQGAFPVITCLEALEFLPSPQQGLVEMTRVLRSGGLLLTTNRVGWEAKLMPGKTWKSAELIKLLENLSFEQISIRPWETIYSQVWAIKSTDQTEDG